MIDLNEIYVETEYTSLYNMRPDELYGMGRESLTISGKSKLGDFLKMLESASSQKHQNNLYPIMGSTESFPLTEWDKYIGRPSNYIVDIKIKQIEKEDYDKWKASLGVRKS